MKRIISIILSVVLCLMTVPCVFAEDGTAETPAVVEKTWDELTLPAKMAFELGLIERDYYDNLALSETVSRAEFAQMLYKLYNYGEDSNEVHSSSCYYTDVETYHYAYKEISFFTEIGVFSGNGDGTFAPEREITGYEAITMIVNVAGFKKLLNEYSVVDIANSIGLFKRISINLDATMTREDAAILLGNSLLINTANYNVNAITLDGDIVLKEFLGLDYIDDIVEAANGVSLYTADYIEDRLQVNNKTYKVIGDNNYSEYVGMNARVFFNDDNEVFGVIPFDNKVLKLDARDIVSYRNNEYKYNENNKEKSVRVDKDMDTLLNGLYSSDTTQMVPDSGYVVLINNDADSNYDVIKIESYKTYVVDNVITDQNTIVMKNVDSDGKQINCRLEDWNEFVLLGKNGIELEINEILEDMVVSLAPSGDERITVYVSSDSIVGNNINIYNDEYEIDGEKYYIIKAPYLNGWDGSSGTGITFLLDVMGNIAGIGKLSSGDWRFGCIVVLKKDKKSLHLMLKLLDEDGVLKDLEFEDKVKIDGVSYTDSDKMLTQLQNCYSQFEEVKPGQAINTENEKAVYDRMSTRLMRYSLSKDGKIKRIDTPVFESKFEQSTNKEIDSEDCLAITSKGRLHYTDTFSFMLRVPYTDSAEINGEVVIDSKTKVFVLPKSLDEISDAETMGVYSSLKSAGCTENKYYAASGYSVKSGSIVDDVVVLAKSSGESSSGLDVGIFTERKATLNKENDVIDVIAGAFDGEKAEYEISDKNNFDVSKLQEGDIILYSLVNGKIKIDSIGFRASDLSGTLVDEPRYITMSGESHYFAKGRIILAQVLRVEDGSAIIKYFGDKHPPEIMPNLKKSYMYSFADEKSQLKQLDMSSVKIYDSFGENADFIIINQREGEIKDEYIIRK